MSLAYATLSALDVDGLTISHISNAQFRELQYSSLQDWVICYLHSVNMDSSIYETVFPIVLE